MQLFHRHKSLFQLPNDTVLFNENAFISINHDFCDFGILQKILQDVQLSDRVENFLPHTKPVLKWYTRRPSGHFIINQIQNHSVADFTGKIDSFHNAFQQQLLSFLQIHPFPPSAGNSSSRRFLVKSESSPQVIRSRESGRAVNTGNLVRLVLAKTSS